MKQILCGTNLTQNKSGIKQVWRGTSLAWNKSGMEQIRYTVLKYVSKQIYNNAIHIWPLYSHTLARSFKRAANYYTRQTNHLTHKDMEKSGKDSMDKRRIRLTIAYDGTKYCGWQIQPNALSVQEVLNEALAHLLGAQVRTIGASRTDAGVHARGNVVIFDTFSRIPADKFSFALNTWLPDDVKVQASEEVAPDWHPHFTDSIKTYEYKILNRQLPDPTRRLDSLFCYGRLDLEAMRQAASYFVGTHDFASFAAGGGATAQAEHSSYETPEKHGTVRTIFQSELFKEHEMIRFVVSGNGFLYNMVRIMAGTLLEVGRGILPADAIPEILAKKDRSAAGPTAPAHGLTLLSISYK